MTETLTIAVFIPTYRRPGPLVALLHALTDQARLPDQIIIAVRHDDHPTRTTLAAWAESSPLGSRHSVVSVEVEGHLPPIVAGLKACGSDLFCQIDDDAIPARDWLLHLEEDFQDHAIGGICGKVLNHPHPEADPVVMEPGHFSWFGRSGPYGSPSISNGVLLQANCPLGGNMAFRSEALRGAVDMILNGGSAVSYETDVALNVEEKGFGFFYDPRVIIDHYPAPRQIEVERGWNSNECFVYAHNLTYISLKHLRWYGKIGFFVYFFLGGSWSCPGVATYLLSLCRGGKMTFKEQLLPAMRGRLAGIKSYRRKLAFQKGAAS